MDEIRTDGILRKASIVIPDDVFERNRRMCLYYLDGNMLL